MLRIYAFLTALVVQIVCYGAENTLPGCMAPENIRRELSVLSDDAPVPVVRKVADRYPLDLFVQLRYQDTFRERIIVEEIEHARKLYETAPENPVARYLRARLLMLSDVKGSRQTFENLLREHPGFAWAHYSLAELMDRVLDRDPAVLENHVRAFLKACPDALQGYALFRSVRNPELIRSAVAGLRRILEQRSAAPPMSWFHLWNMELKASGPAAREQIVADAQALRAGFVPTTDWYRTFSTAANLSGDDSIRDWVENKVLEQAPDSEAALQVERARWGRANPPPDRSAGRDAWNEYSSRRAAAHSSWVRRWPRDPSLAINRYQDLRSPAATEWTREEKLSVIDSMLQVLTERPGFITGHPPMPLQLASACVQERLRLDRVPELLEAARRESELQERYPLDAAYVPPEYRNRLANPERSSTDVANRVAAEYFIAMKQPNRARPLVEVGLREAESALEKATPERRGYIQAIQRGDWLESAARLAALEDKTTQALSYYRERIQSYPAALIQGSPYNDKLVREVREYYLGHGGTEAQWPEWAGGRTEASQPRSPELRFETVIREFSMTDTAGRKWTQADLKGKVTLVDVWATWCGPCRAEHAELQKFYERIKDRTDIQLLTISIDEHAFIAAEYVAQHKFTFPVIVSSELASSAFPALGVPAAYVVDKSGRRSQLTRFSDAPLMLTLLDSLVKQ
jgi:thiol-disulfide isomerase/thioredoxin